MDVVVAFSVLVPFSVVLAVVNDVAAVNIVNDAVDVNVVAPVV